MRKYRIALWSKNKKIASNCFYMGTLRGAKTTATREIQKFAAIHGNGQYKAYIIMDTPSKRHAARMNYTVSNGWLCRDWKWENTSLGRRLKAYDSFYSQSYESTVEHREMQLQEWAAEQRNHERMEA